jgi:cyclic pyranopterin phosphate synthase
MSDFTHFTNDGRPQMVNVGEKALTRRMAVAGGRVTMSKDTLNIVKSGGLKKGDVLSVAQLAGIMGAKQTAHLIPLCHPLALSHVDVQLTLNEPECAIDVWAECHLNGKTGVEMEALTAVSVAALTIYDMCKAVDKAMVISDIRLLHKSGGKSGTFNAD